MVNSKDFAQNSNSYYRPSLDDDDKTFFPKQGTLPLYFFQNGIYQPQEEEPQLFFENLAIEEKDQITSNYYLYFVFLFLFILFFIIKKVRWEFGNIRTRF
jgi:hypothetical protein